MNAKPNKHETHIEGLKYVAEYLSDRKVDTEIVKDGNKAYLKIINENLEGMTIGVGALQEHDSYPMSKISSEYTFIFIVTGLRYNIKRVYKMTDKEARLLANDATHDDEKIGRVTQSQLTPYRDRM